jgi:hypothetical protein
MRFSSLIALGLFVTAAPALAQAPAGGKIVAASYTCSQRVPCPENGSNLSPAQWATAGNACIAQAFGRSNPDGIIDEVAGLDSSGDLSTKLDSVPKRSGAQLVPECSVVNMPNGGCSIHCNLEQQ